MDRKEEYELLCEMIDSIQSEIAKDTKGKLYLIAELHALQQDMKDLCSEGIQLMAQIEKIEITIDELQEYLVLDPDNTDARRALQEETNKLIALNY